MNRIDPAPRPPRLGLAASSRPRAFTLIELLTVIAIIGILAAIIIPVAGHVRENARNTQCIGNLRQVAMAALLYASENKNEMPRISDSWPPANGYRETWLYRVWPYANQNQAEVDRDIIVLTARGPIGRGNVFICPSVNNTKYETPVFGNFTPNWNLFCYGLNNLSPDVYSAGRVKLAGLKSPSRTCMLSESCFVSGTGTAYRNHYGMLPHGGGANFAFYDGRVERRAKASVPDLVSPEGLVFWRGQ